MFIHPKAEVLTKAIGEGTRVWQFAVIAEGAVIGKNCNINCHSFIEGKVRIGNNVTIKSGVFLWNGVAVHDNVFIGPNASFTNDRFPRSKQHIEPVETVLQEGCSIGAHATIIAGIKIGRFAMVGAGSVVTKDVPCYALVYGNPARVMGWVDEQGRKLTAETETVFVGEEGIRYEKDATGLCRI